MQIISPSAFADAIVSMDIEAMPGHLLPFLAPETNIPESLLARYLRIEPDTLRKWRQRGRGPAWIGITGEGGRSNRIGYLVRDVLAWQRTLRVDPNGKTRGRPVGSKNKIKAVADATATANAR